MCAAVVLVVGMVAAINLAVPLFAASALHPSAPALVWIVDTYVIVFACLVIPAGAAGDRFGRKGVLLTGLGLFAAGTLLSAAAPDVAVLLAGRALTGIGAAAVLSNSLAVLLHAVPAERTPATIATWASMTGIGGVAGNVGGGLVLTAGSWRWLFAAAAAVSLGLAALVARGTPVSSRHDRPLGPLAAVLLTGASVALLLGIVQGPEAGWGSAVVVTAFAASAVLFAAWVGTELRSAHPLLDPRLFRIAGLRSACLGLTAIFFGMFALFYVNASFLQYAKGFGVLATGLGIVPLTVPIVLGGRHVGRLAGRIGLDTAVACAFGFVGAGLLGLSTSDAGHPVCRLRGLARRDRDRGDAGVADAVGRDRRCPAAGPGRVGTGLQATTREFGSALGVAVVGTVSTARFAAALPPDVRGAHTVAEALARAPRASDVVTAFVAGTDAGLRVAGVAVLVLGGLVVAESRWSRRKR
ncbi:major facilitator transporter [Amycolatopsis mediterranei RB]|nr:major facilitator transporter [Amycolatopsis mediterranei RB]